VFIDRFGGGGFEHVWATLFSFEPALLALGLLGVGAWIVAALRGRRRPSPELLVVLAYAVPYLVVIGMYEFTFQRFAIQLLPYLACAAAWGLDRAWSSPVRARRMLAHGLALGALVVSAACAVRLVHLRRVPDPAARTAAWIADHVGGEERVALLPFIDLPLLRDPDALDDLQGLAGRAELTVLSPWTSYQVNHRERLPEGPCFDLHTPRLGRRKNRDAALADPIEYLRATGARWAVVSSNLVEDERGLVAVLLRELNEHAHPAARFPSEPTAGGGDRGGTGPVPLDATDTSRWWERNWTLALPRGDVSAGHTLHVFRLD
jgi:hypothetical protein